MLTRLSHLFVRTLREDPVDAEVDSHKLLARAGYIRRQAPGVFAWLPLGLKVRRKIENVIREELEAFGAQEVHFPALLPREPYEATNRWEEYGPNLFRLKDRKGAVSYGSAGIGSTQHLSAELLKSLAKVEATHIPYKGAAPMMTDLIGERNVPTGVNDTRHVSFLALSGYKAP